ncbi:MAG TPA: hypothetical protein VGN18_13910 [Jatrophihabitans sp.]|jgi:hypothetical protein|uniref:hypothetical protein n=1 Tax=Jatrophihabitans sp. TaxID=1932789 RepID=UPI002DFB10FF|nr:hypothetical protein [Jatrophihabitans sp.]
MRLRLAAAGLALLAVAGCSGSGAPRKSSVAPPSSASPLATATARPGTPVAPAVLAAQLQTAVATVRSARLRLDLTLAGEAVSGTGAETLTRGRLDTLTATEKLPSLGVITVVVVGDTTYARLPAALLKTDKPWVRVSATSTNAAVRQLASTIAIAKSSASLSSVSGFAAAAISLNRVGPTRVGGVAATDYSMVIAPDKLPRDFPGRADLVATGLTAVPVQLALDAKSRPVRVAITASVSGQSVDTTLALSHFDEPVTITAPPAASVSSI